MSHAQATPPTLDTAEFSVKGACPRCGLPFAHNGLPGAVVPPALSRHDRERYDIEVAVWVCSRCGTLEALEDAGMLPAWNGDSYWLHPTPDPWTWKAAG